MPRSVYLIIRFAYIICTFAVCLSLHAQDSLWHVQYPSVDFSAPTKLCAVNDSVLIVLSNGYVLRSIDSGMTWQRINFPEDFTPNAVLFWGDSLGWLAGSKGMVYTSHDKGATWRQANTPSTYYNLLNISFGSPSIGYIGSDYGVVMKSTDGGANWAFSDFGNLYNPFYNSYVKAIDDSTAWLCLVQIQTGVDQGTGIILWRTTNGGSSWASVTQKVNGPPRKWDGWDFFSDFSSLVCCSATDASFFFAYGDSINYQWYRFSTTDGGMTWDSVLADVTHTDSACKYNNMFSCSTGWGTDSSLSALWLSVNPNSISWVKKNNPCGGACYPLLYDFLNNTTGWSITNNGNNTVSVYETSDGAQTWQMKGTFITNSGTLQDVSFLNPEMGWCAGNLTDSTPVILRTTNGGNNWIIYNNNMSAGTMRNPLRQIQFVNASTGWVLGDSIYKSTDGGATWNVDALFPLNPLRAQVHYIKIQFVDSLTGWIARNDWLTYRTTDGGATWGVAHTADSAVTLTVAKAVNGEILLEMGLVSDSAYEFRVLGGGTSFQDFPLSSITIGGGNTPTTPKYFSFTDAQHGWFADDNADFYATTDAGNSWRYAGTPVGDVPLEGLLYITDSTGWLLQGGLNPAIIHISDTMLDGTFNPVRNTLYAMTFLGDSSGWAVGSNLSIYHYYFPIADQPTYKPILILSNNAINFGTITPGNTKTKNIMLFNKGNVNLNVSDAKVENDSYSVFNVATIVSPLYPLVVGPGDSAKFSVDFNPNLYQAFDAKTVIYTNADTADIELIGIGAETNELREANGLLASGGLESYPNPFSGTTHIILKSEESRSVRAYIIDMLGNKIASFTPDELNNEMLQWTPDASIPTGTYFIVVRSASGVTEMPLVLVK